MGVSLAVRLCAACYHSTLVTRRPEAPLCAARNPLLTHGGIDWHGIAHICIRDILNVSFCYEGLNELTVSYNNQM